MDTKLAGALLFIDTRNICIVARAAFTDNVA